MTLKPAFSGATVGPVPDVVMGDLAESSRKALSDQFTEAGFVKLLMSLNDQLEGCLDNLLILLAITGDSTSIVQVCFYWLARSGYELLPYSELEMMVKQKQQELCKPPAVLFNS